MDKKYLTFHYKKKMKKKLSRKPQPKSKKSYKVISKSRNAWKNGRLMAFDRLKKKRS